MGHESRIEPWGCQLTTVLLAEFQIGLASSLRAMKTPRKENRNLGLPAFTGTMRTDPNTPSSITWGSKQQKLRPHEKREKRFLLTSPSIERPSGNVDTKADGGESPGPQRMSAASRFQTALILSHFLLLFPIPISG